MKTLIKGYKMIRLTRVFANNSELSDFTLLVDKTKIVSAFCLTSDLKKKRSDGTFSYDEYTQITLINGESHLVWESLYTLESLLNNDV